MTFLKTAGVILAFILIIPLAVWAGSGSRSHAWFALKQYAVAMGVIVVPVLALVGIVLVLEFMS